MGCGRKTPFTPYERSLLGRFCGRTSHNDSPYISPFVEDMVLFFRFLSNIETRVSCSSNPSFLGFHTQAVFLIILGCGFYFELFSGCALLVLFVAAVFFLLGTPLPLTTCYRPMRDVTMREFCQTDSSNISPFVGDMVSFRLCQQSQWPITLTVANNTHSGQ